LINKNTGSVLVKILVKGRGVSEVRGVRGREREWARGERDKRLR
jgi:hypothetical protein